MRRLAYLLSQFPELHETFILRELAGLRRRGVAVTVYSLKTCRDDIIHPEVEDLGAIVVTCPFVLSWAVWAAQLVWLVRRPRRYLGALWWALWGQRRCPREALKSAFAFPKVIRFADHLHRRAIDHVHAHWMTQPATAAVIMSRLLDIPFSVTAHAWDIHVPHPLLGYKLVAADWVTTCTHYNQEYLRSLIAEQLRGKVLLHYHGLDPRQFDPDLTSVGDDPDGGDDAGPPLLLSIGRMVETKGFPCLIEALARLVARGVQARLTIVGTGPLRKELVRAVAGHRLDDVVTLAGPEPQVGIRRKLRRCRAFVLPCVIARNGDRDGIPNVILEAMAMARPVVTTAVSGIPEIVRHGDTGLLVPPEDSRALAEALERVLSDDHLANALGLRARAAVRAQFDLERNTAALLATFEQRVFARQEPVTVALVIWSLAVGGAERVVAQLARGLDRRRFRPVVWCLNEAGELGRALREDGVEVIGLGKRHGIDPWLPWRLAADFRARRVVVAHTQLWGGNLWGRLGAWLAGVPVVIAHEHGLERWRGRWHDLVDRVLARVTSRVAFVAEAAAEQYRRRVGVAAARTAVIANGVEVERFASAPGRARDLPSGFAAADGPVLLAIGRLVPEKGYDHLLQAMVAVRARLPRARLLIAGDGPLAGALEATRARLRLDDAVFFLGSRADVPELLASAEVVVQASTKEAAPLAVLEAMAAGRPVVATAVGGIPGVITDGRTGRLVAAGSPTALSDAIVDALLRPEQARVWGEAARDYVRAEHGVERMVAAYEALYEECLSDCSAVSSR